MNKCLRNVLSKIFSVLKQVQYNYDFKEYCFITHNTQYLRLFVNKCKIATNTTLQEQNIHPT